MRDISKKIFWIILVTLIFIRVVMILFVMKGIPYTAVSEGGWWFNPGGDEVQYFNLAKSITQLNLKRSKVTLGYPLFLAPFIYFTNAQSVKGILKPVFIIQAFILFSLSIILVALISEQLFKIRKIAIFSATIFTFYPYLFYIFFRHLGPYYPNMGLYRGEMAFLHLNWLHPLSDPLSAFLVYLSFFIFLRVLKRENFQFPQLMLLGILTGFSALVRMVNILIAGIFFLGWILRKKIKEVILVSATSFFIIFPQLIYNYIFFNSPFKFGYQVYGGESLISQFSFLRWIHLFEKANFYIPGFVLFFLGFVIFLILGIKYLWEKEKIVSFVITLWFLSYFLIYSSFIEGGLQPRFFIPAIPPFIFILIGAFLKIFKK